MDIVVFGANGPTGRLLVGQALAAGHAVTAVTRDPDGFPLSDASLRVVEADVHDTAAVASVVRGADAVLSALGVPYGRQPITVYSDGATNILNGMRAAGVRRFACVSSSAIDPAAGPHGGFFFERVLQPVIVNLFGKQLYTDMRRMEAIVTASDLDWTIVRPSGLFDASGVSEYDYAERYTPGAFTSRADLADALLRQATEPEYVRTIVAVSTSAGAPTVRELIVREALGKK
ncbi:SDR family oxidoreductase [Leifsonia sp. PS1209]|uniref:NAD(P)-dependent oxidoreductase n=1 Tax=Leifsonia sp. PS1209 TaxID=2724914 RepID=UPI001442C540|nr:SDR family oxidoreductase [Leifsonia sp. PS1209]QJA00281.1 SDR family oxidoreductase [Leifsonia sp. PS1209]